MLEQVIEHFVDTQKQESSEVSSRVQINGPIVNGGAEHNVGLDYVTLASTTEGYSINDLKDLTLAATQQSSIRSLKDNSSGVSPHLGGVSIKNVELTHIV